MEQSVYGGCANKMQFNLVGSDNVTIARQALAAYDLPGYELVFLRHSDNVTFRAEKPGSEPYLLRIHIPITTAMGTHGTDPAMIQSELLWLEALNQDTDLVLQKPARNKAGELVTRISVVGTETHVNCTLLSWLPGQPYQRDLESESNCQPDRSLVSEIASARQPVEGSRMLHSPLAGLCLF